MSGTLITDDGLAFLKSLPRLERLRLDGTNVTDVGLEYLVEIENLRYLDLSGTKVSPKGLCILKKIAAMQVLTIKRRNFTSDEHKAIHGSIPNVDINK